MKNVNNKKAITGIDRGDNHHYHDNDDFECSDDDHHHHDSDHEYNDDDFDDVVVDVMSGHWTLGCEDDCSHDFLIHDYLSRCHHDHRHDNRRRHHDHDKGERRLEGSRALLARQLVGLLPRRHR